MKHKKCKYCKELFTPVRPLQYLCIPPKDCGWKYAEKKMKERLEKEVKENIKKWRPEVKKGSYQKRFQDQINLLARKIDAKYNYLCIDCGRNYGEQVDGAHYHDIGGNSTLRYNLHNIHSADSQCNKFSSKHKEGYRKGLISRYGEDYAEYVIEKLPLQYKEIHLTGQDIIEKLKIATKLNREFDTFTFTSAKQARDILNAIINIYENPELI